MRISIARASALTDNCILSTTCDGALALCKLPHHRRKFYARICGSGTRPHEPSYTFYIVRRRPCSEKKFPSHRPEILHREALVGAPTVPIHPLSSRNFLITGRTFHARICGSGTRPHDPLYIFHYIRGGPCSGKCFHHRPAQNPPPEAFGRRARRPTRVPSGNFIIPGRTFYARIYGSGTRVPKTSAILRSGLLLIRMVIPGICSVTKFSSSQNIGSQQCWGQRNDNTTQLLSQPHLLQFPT